MAPRNFDPTFRDCHGHPKVEGTPPDSTQPQRVYFCRSFGVENASLTFVFITKNCPSLNRILPEENIKHFGAAFSRFWFGHAGASRSALGRSRTTRGSLRPSQTRLRGLYQPLPDQHSDKSPQAKKKSLSKDCKVFANQLRYYKHEFSASFI